MELSAETPPFPAVLELSPTEGRLRAAFEVRNATSLPLVARFVAASPAARIVPMAIGLSAGTRQQVIVELASPPSEPGETLSVSWRRLGADAGSQWHTIALRLEPAAAPHSDGEKVAPGSRPEESPVGSPALRSASVLALFEDLRPTGEGSWTGRDGSLGSFRVQEVRSVPSDAGCLERATALLGFDDPAITRLRKWLEEEETLYLVTDAPAGEPLAGWASRTREDLTPSSVADLGWGIAVALGLLHAAGIPHGALSPAVIFRCTDGRLQLGSFCTASDATPSGDARDAAALLLALLPPEAWWAADAERAFQGIDSVAALYRAIEALGQAAQARPPSARWDAAIPTPEDPDPGSSASERFGLQVEESIQLADLEPAASELLHTSDMVISSHETAEAEASPELEMDTAIGHVPVELVRRTAPPADEG